MRRACLLMALFLVVTCGRIPGGPADVSPAISPTASPTPTATSPTPSPSPTIVCLSAALPSARTLAAFAYAPSVHQAVLFGGHDASNNLLNDTWVRQDGCWSQLHPTQSPPPNTIVPSAYDENRESFLVLVYGASGGSSYLDLTTWLWNGQNWDSPLALARACLRDRPPMTRHPAASSSSR